ncbi:putative AP-3 complex subunit delta [Aspergillus clavatus NRRL 1]|uniref:AP-3 complex subunit delta n=1 Tax=Aspergillus clavatus (strain ATCC 1007 / CBS 513.65 / DSM 816 / NCTC 3887 / NRRL 1 / QM 1276 / 107) TaxID=344612 RepID=A1CD52_ASPCL|nr:AP-3 complex subunit delta, putative [Aspergillus clavatus NRRL 1]EAW11779.1 AP-3 complex subunit delta, putative [Aspergillus clavatus NRRL 1]
MDKKATALLKVIYLEMFGYDMSWVSFHVLEVMSSARYLQKRAGYLGAVQSFRSDTEVLMLATNLLKKDLTSSNISSMSLAVAALPHIITPSLAMSLLPDILSRLSHSRAVIRKKAIVCLYRFALVYPEALKLAWPKLKERLMDDEEECSVTTAVINVICELGWRRPQDFLPLAPRLFDLLVDGGNNWMAIKIIKLFATLTPLEPRLIRKLNRPLMKIIQTTTAMSLLYECINGIIQGGILDGDETSERDEIARLCVGKLRGMIVADSDPNLKYVGLLAFNRIVSSHPGLVSVHYDVIMDCLEDADVSIRLQALDLVAKLVNSETLQFVVNRLVKQLQSDEANLQDSKYAKEPESSRIQPAPSALPDNYRVKVMHQILDICCFNNYSELPDFVWYVDLLVQLMKLLPRQIGDLRVEQSASQLAADQTGLDIAVRIGTEIQNIAVRVKGVRTEATRAAECLILVETRRILFINSYGNHLALGPIAWVVGEYSDCLSSPSQTLRSLIDTSNMSLPAKTLSFFIQAIPKVLVRLIHDTKKTWSTIWKGETSLLLSKITEFFEHLAVHPDLDVQERAIEFLELMRLAADALPTGSHSSDAMPFLLSSIMPGLFCGLELNPVAFGALRKVPRPEHLVLGELYNPQLWGILGDDSDCLFKKGSQHACQEFYHVRDTFTTHNYPAQFVTFGAHLNRPHGPLDHSDETPTTSGERRAERRERNKEDPFYILAEEITRGTGSRDGGVSQDRDFDIDSIPIVDLDISNLESPQAASLHAGVQFSTGLRSRKHDVAVDETIGYEDSTTLRNTEEHVKAKKSLLQIDSSGLGHFPLGSRGISLTTSANRVVDMENDMEISRAVQEVERLRLEMQRASERIHPQGIPLEGTPVKRKKKLNKKSRTPKRTPRVRHDFEDQKGGSTIDS